MSRIAELAPAAVTDALSAVLSGVADPDAAVNLFVRLLEADANVARALAELPVLTYYATTIFGHSQWLGETVVRAPELLTGLGRDKSVERSLARDEYAERLARYRTRSDACDAATLLSRFKRREYVRIVLRDLLGIATLSDATAELSALADVIIAEAARLSDQQLRDRYGPPQALDGSGRIVEPGFAVLALGKLGGNELNYSSDIDLLFLYADGEARMSTELTNREYFVRLAQEVTAMLSRSTAEGAAYRIDLRLRPQGTEGELAVSLSHALDYYARRAADWELQALIKVRHAAGDQRLAREFIRVVQPFVYVERLNFAAVETAVRSGERIQSRRQQKNARATLLDVKVDRGGIRDIEFLVQCLQRVYGGKERWLRSCGTMFSLQKLHDKGHISGRDFHELTSAYEFLRTVEHRLQLRQGQQTHQLPTDEERLATLARGLTPRFLEHPSTDLLMSTLRSHMEAVRRIYERIIHQQQVVERAEHDAEFRLRSLAPAGREASQADILQRLAHDSPYIHRLARQEFSPHARANLFKFLGAAFTSGERYRALLQNQECFAAALRILAASDFLTDLLVRDPEELAQLAGIHEAGISVETLISFASDRESQTAFVEFVAGSQATAADRLALIRGQYRSRIFASGARDILQRRNVFESLAQTSAIARESIAAAITLVPWPDGLAVFALGRLGTDEFDILSDADLVFVRDEHVPNTAASQAAVGLMQSLSAYTRDGTLFPVDARLRPHGQAGELTVTPAELLRYFQSEAQPWEALTWTKLRFVHGPQELGDRVSRAACELLRRVSESEAKNALRSLRERLERSEDPESLRTGAGALYDLDYIAAYLLACQPGRFGGNLRQRFQVLQTTGQLDADTYGAMVAAAELFRTVDHAVRLATGTSRSTVPAAGHARDAVETLVRAAIPEIDGSLDEALSATRAKVRAAFDRTFA